MRGDQSKRVWYVGNNSMGEGHPDKTRRPYISGKRILGRWMGIEADRVRRHALKVNSVSFTVCPEPVFPEL